MLTIISDFTKMNKCLRGGGGIPANVTFSDNEYCILGYLQGRIFW